MKKRIRLTLILTVIITLAAAWTWRYVALNKHYDDLDNGDYKLYQVGELVPFEDDGNDLYTDLNGYYVRVDGYEIQNYGDYLADADFTIARDENDPDKIVLVYITLVNESCEPNPISLPDLKLRGVDTPLNMDWDILTQANPCLEGHTAIALNAGTEQKLILPYGLRMGDFRGSTWRNLDEYALYLQVTGNLTQKEVLINQ